MNCPFIAGTTSSPPRPPRGNSSGGSNHFEMGDFGLSESSDEETAPASGTVVNRAGNSSYTSVPLLDSEWSDESSSDEVLNRDADKNNKGQSKNTC